MDDAILAQFGDRILLGEDVQVDVEAATWEVKLTWQATQPIATNYACSLHILGPDGRDLAQRDFEGGPGYGFWPTSAWPIGEWITDRLSVPIPEDVDAGDAAALSIVLYDRAQPGFPAAGKAIVPLVEREHNFEVPTTEHVVVATFGDRMKLLGYDLSQRESRLEMTLYWQATGPMSTDWTVFVHLYDPSSEEILTQWDARPLSGAYPTSWWREGEVIADKIALDLTDLSPGTYRLEVGLYDPSTSERLPVATTSQAADPSGRLALREINITD
jgi:hypothetical protein